MPMPPEMPSLHPTATAEQPRLLLVVPCDDVALALRRGLPSTARRVATAGAALAALDAEAFDAVVLLDADEAAADALRNAHPAVPLVEGPDIGAVEPEPVLRAAREAIARVTLAARAEAAERRFARAFEGSPVPAAFVSLEPVTAGRVLRANHGMAALLGTDPEALAGSELHAHAHWEDRQRAQAAFAGGGDHRDLGVRLVRADGRVVWTQATVLELPPDPQQGRTAIVRMTDVTERRQAERRLREATTALDTAVIGIVRVDPLGRVVWANPAAERLAGSLPAGQDWLAGAGPSERLLVDAAVTRMLDEGRAEASCRLRGRDCEVVLVRVLDDDGALLGHVAFLRDVTERVAAERRYRAVVESTQDAVLLLGRDGLQYANAAAAHVLGSGEAAERIVEEVADAPVAPGRPVQRDVRLDGGRWGLLTATAVAGGDGDVLVIVRDITDRKRSELALAERALHDPLTGLPNRALLLDRLEHALARRGDAVGLLFVDLDRFKRINDELGHEAGDEALRAVVPRLQAAVRAGDTVARLGGDEFIVLCEAVRDEDEAAAVGERVRRTLRGAPLRVGAVEVEVRASIGVATSAGRDVTADALLRDADTAMYRAKEHGGDRVQRFDAAMRARRQDDLELERDLRQAIDRGELTVVFQPIVALPGAEPTGFEALLRWPHPTRGAVSPAVFVPLAERSGLIGRLGRMVLDTACAQVARWRSAHPGAPWARVCVNVSPAQLAEPGFPDLVGIVLERHRVPPGSLTLELTETALLASSTAAGVALDALHARGLRLVLDDFGTGFSSLSHLAAYPVDGVKVDRSFVAGLLDDRGSARPVVEGVVGMAHALGIDVVAEGVETLEQARALAALGCGAAQGFFFARPMPADEAIRWAADPPPAPLPLSGGEELLTLQEATAALGISASTLRRWADSGRLRVVRTAGGHRRVPAGEVARLNQRRTDARRALRLPPPEARPHPALAALVRDEGERLARIVVGRLYEPGAAGVPAGPVGGSALRAWLQAVAAAAEDGDIAAGDRATTTFVRAVVLAGGSAAEALILVEQLGEALVATLARGRHAEEAPGARRLLTALRRRALASTL
jgi:diguanylate cyclase (GGDEF)-like protein/PAS domain S-box-containing protein/excisionase family DNA binding protein